jgi:hypothetical protein
VAGVQLPLIDEHHRQIDASPDRVWDALLVTVERLVPDLPRWLAAAWGLQHPTRTGARNRAVTVGDTVPGFIVSELDPGRVLTLRGRHRFSDYELRFELDQPFVGRTRLRATSLAAFPGLKGRLYRSLVIGTRGHRVAVRRILGSVARKAEGPRGRA